MKKSYPSLINDVEEYITNVVDDIDVNKYKKCIIFGNGPSLLTKTVDVKDSFVCRTNWFFLEEKPRFGTRVDAYFYSIYNQEMLKQLSESCYQIRRHFRPFNIFTSPTNNEYLYEGDVYNVINHWVILSKYPEIAKQMIKRPLPTQGVQMILTMAALGFVNIETYGIDFYKNLDKRYCYEQNERSIKALQTKDITPGYEKDHSFEKDKKLVSLAKILFPKTDIRIM